MKEFNSSHYNAAQITDEPIDPGFSVPDQGTTIPPADGVIDPDFSVTPPRPPIDPDFSVNPPVPPIDPDFSVNPPGPIDPDFSVVPPVYPINPPFIPNPGIPCIFCNNNQWIRGGIRLLNAATGYNPFTVFINNRQVSTGLNFSEITQYRQIPQGYHSFTITGPNGYVYLRKSIYIGDGMSTVAIINSSGGIDLTTIEDKACPASNTSACFRLCNLAFYTGAVNANLGNVFFNAVNFNEVTSFSQFESGNYTLNVSRSARPETVLVTSLITLNPRRIYTAYVLNWNPSTDTVQTLLVEDRRS